MVENATSVLLAARVDFDRAAAGVSKRRLAKLTHIDRGVLTQKLLGHAEFKVSELVRIANALDLPAERWLTDLPSPEGVVA